MVMITEYTHSNDSMTFHSMIWDIFEFVTFFFGRKNYTSIEVIRNAFSVMIDSILLLMSVSVDDDWVAVIFEIATSDSVYCISTLNLQCPAALHALLFILLATAVALLSLALLISPESLPFAARCLNSETAMGI